MSKHGEENNEDTEGRRDITHASTHRMASVEKAYLRLYITCLGTLRLRRITILSFL